jgi:hypothetical protein
MAEFRNEATLLVNTVIAVGLALLISQASFGLPTTIVGIILLLILYTYDQGRHRTAGQSLAYAAVAALPFTLALAIGIERIADRRDLETWLVVTWLCATVVATAVDRARMSARAAEPATTPAASAPGGRVSAPSPESAAQRSSRAPAPARPASAPKYGLGLGGLAREESLQAHSEVINRPEAAAPEPSPAEPAPLTPPEPEAAALSAQPVAPPSPQARPAEEATIYINVTDQGISLLRSVRAQHIARDIYRIVDSVPEGEVWRYQPGETVRCRKQKLSVGKALVAFEAIVLKRAN